MVGVVGMDIVRKNLWVPEWLRDASRRIDYGQTFARVVKKAIQYLPGDQFHTFMRELSPHGLTFQSALYGKVRRRETGSVEDWGLLSTKFVTDGAAQYIVDAFQGITTLQMFRYHAIGSGNTAENQNQTGLVFEFNAQTNPASIRQAGTLTEGGSNNVFRTVATTTASATNIAVVEHGIFTFSALVGSMLLDRSVFSVINLANGDSIQTTYDLTVTPGG